MILDKDIMVAVDRDGIEIKWNERTRQWEYPNGDLCIKLKRKRICKVCNKPRLDINGVENCDYCLQSLTLCDFITDACCGHGIDDNAYICLADGRRFILDTVLYDKLQELEKGDKDE